jgi:DNA-binding MarR family transcriptional regulator
MSESEPLDFGIVLALAYSAFVDELRAELAAAGHAELHRSFGYVARALTAEPLTLRELAERLAITSPGASKIVDEMQRTGHLERVPDAVDGRAKRLRLTRRGKAALAAARRIHARFEAELAERVGPHAARQCRVVLQSIIAERALSGSPPALRPV